MPMPIPKVIPYLVRLTYLSCLVYWKQSLARG